MLENMEQENRQEQNFGEADNPYLRPDSELYVQPDRLVSAEIPRGKDGLPRRERRKKRSDVFINAAAVSSVLAWVAIVIALPILLEARPSSGVTIFATLLQFAVEPTNWNNSLLRTVFVLLISALGISALGIALNLLRHRRKTDRFRKSLFISGGVSLAGLIVFVITLGIPVG